MCIWLLCAHLLCRFLEKHGWGGVIVYSNDLEHENLRKRPSATNSYARSKVYLTLNFEAECKIRRDTTVKVGRRYKMNVCMLSETPLMDC